MVHLSVVVPLFNESSLIRELVKRVKNNAQTITNEFEIILVDDGSQDKTWEAIENEAKSDSRLKAIKLSRNFGHHYALTAGLHNASGEWVVVMDGDLQDRPEVIPQLYKKALEGFDVVFVSRQNRPESLLYRSLQKLFYRLLRVLSGIAFDSRQANFSIISRKVVEAFKRFPENARFYGSTIKWLGFNRSYILADHGTRYSGKPSYTFKKRVNLALDVIISFSDRPLKASIFLGLFLSVLSLIFMSFIIFRALYFGFDVVGWASIIAVLLFSTGVVLIVIGISSIYIAEIFKQVKHRPLYIIDRKIGI
jgi:dolichol-phosphate mannosyltransferase